MNSHLMIYNSQKELLEIPEYGRNLQDLIKHTNNIEDEKQRQLYIEKVLHLMMQMHPQNKNIEDATGKMWKHIFRIANYDLNIEPPEDVKLDRDNYKKKPESISYPQKNPKFKHYGSNVKELILKAIEMEEGDKKQAFVSIIGNYMKLAYKTWNREHFVSDELILNDLATLSDDKLKLKEGVSLDNLTISNKNKKRSYSNNPRNNNRRKSNNRRGRR